MVCEFATSAVLLPFCCLDLEADDWFVFHRGGVALLIDSIATSASLTVGAVSGGLLDYHGMASAFSSRMATIRLFCVFPSSA